MPRQHESLLSISVKAPLFVTANIVVAADTKLKRDACLSNMTHIRSLLLIDNRCHCFFHLLSVIFSLHVKKPLFQRKRHRWLYGCVIRSTMIFLCYRFGVIHPRLRLFRIQKIEKDTRRAVRPPSAINICSCDVYFSSALKKCCIRSCSINFFTNYIYLVTFHVKFLSNLRRINRKMYYSVSSVHDKFRHILLYCC